MYLNLKFPTFPYVQARQIVVQCGEMLRVGVTTDQIDQLVFDMAMAHKAYPSPLNYKGFPKSVCTSVNNVSEPMTFSKNFTCF